MIEPVIRLVMEPTMRLMIEPVTGLVMETIVGQMREPNKANDRASDGASDGINDDTTMLQQCYNNATMSGASFRTRLDAKPESIINIIVHSKGPIIQLKRELHYRNGSRIQSAIQ